MDILYVFSMSNYSNSRYVSTVVARSTGCWFADRGDSAPSDRRRSESYIHPAFGSGREWEGRTLRMKVEACSRSRAVALWCQFRSELGGACSLLSASRRLSRPLHPRSPPSPRTPRITYHHVIRIIQIHVSILVML